MFKQVVLHSVAQRVPVQAQLLGNFMEYYFKKEVLMPDRDYFRIALEEIRKARDTSLDNNGGEHTYLAASNF